MYLLRKKHAPHGATDFTQSDFYLGIALEGWEVRKPCARIFRTAEPEVELGDPERGEVLVEIKASGVCHTDFDSMSWKRRMIMGHEGAGIVRKCGEGVTHVRPRTD
jgi:Alcohol dehydrogenase GroES-like domain